ncbi:hypothetical protein M231_06257 [Tremella mesenterica]|uniref:AB hydrolase-1 domain-containing protein n=1 Tax=Tremella mesenterica TaxID=5217 RepID=A0A4Q1BGG0_TREME|nr:hypothetical protein M231_06257 [Tremella mesenterica]
MGHSTGSQDVIHYLSSSSSTFSPLAPVQGRIMHAPISDREYFESNSAEGDDWGWGAQLEIAKGLIVEEQSQQVLDRNFCQTVGGPVTAYRLHSLVGVGGDDDYFSSDLPDTLENNPMNHKHPLSTSFGRLSAPALAIYSKKDETCRLPDISATLDRWTSAAGAKLETVILEGAGHSVDVRWLATDSVSSQLDG